MNLNDCVKEILENFTSGDYFDSHTVINELIKNPDYHIHYVKECPENCAINQYHGLIAQEIKKSGIAEAIGTAKSHTIYGDISENELWQKKS